MLLVSKQRISCKKTPKKLEKEHLGVTLLFRETTAQLDVLVIFCLFFFVGGVLLVLVLSDEISDVLVSFLELHLVHTFTLVPMEESFSSVHRSELGGKSLKDALQSSGVCNKSGGHVRCLWGGRDNASLEVIWDPLNKIVSVFGVEFLHIVINFLCGEVSSEGEVGSHVLAIFWSHVGEEVSGGVCLVVSSRTLRPVMLDAFLLRSGAWE